jgi:nitrilase
MTSGTDVAANLAAAETLLATAVENEAELVVLPENFAFLSASGLEAPALGEPYGAGPIQDFLSQQARTHRIWLVGGTLPVATRNPRRIRAACLLYDNEGRCVARYDKIHLFDVSLDDANDEHYMESQAVEPGSRAVVAATPLGRLGLAVCYDVRFPELFRTMVLEGAQIFALPAAFTATTGRVHWDLLVRTRAVENLAPVIAAAQTGQHGGGRQTYGHSQIVDPWGATLACQPTGTGVIVHDIDLAAAAKLRRQFPALDHIRLLGRSR